MVCLQAFEPPPVLDLVFYREVNPDLKTLNDDELKEHWLSFGLIEGRRANKLRDRNDFANLAAQFKPDLLEVSPFANPLVKGAVTCDVLNKVALRARAREHSLDPTKIPSPDWVIDPQGDGLSAIPRQFRAVLSSHVIEHSPDLAEHLLQVASILEPLGLYFILVPDRRYCFDAALPDSTIADLIQAHHEARKRHTLQSVIEHRALTTHNDALRHWNGDHWDREYREAILPRTIQAISEFEAAGQAYIDVHAWKFTPDSFSELMPLVTTIYEIPLELVRVYPTLHSSNEFWAIFRRH